mgnify:CR=1 FL=1
MKKFSNKLAIVTGGNSGIGFAAAKELISEGATVIITGRRKEAVEKAAQELGAIPCTADQANLNDIDLLKEKVDNGEGKVGFGIYPVSFNDMIKISDLKLSMPPKCTFIEPKLITALLMYDMKP